MSFAVVFMNITRRETLPQKASIHTLEMTTTKIALKEIYKSEDKKWIIYTQSHSMQSNKENHPILNQIRYKIS